MRPLSPRAEKNERAGKIIGTGVGGAWALSLAIQVRLYRSITGIRGWDHFLWTAYLTECAVGVLIGTNSMAALGRKAAQRAGAGDPGPPAQQALHPRAEATQDQYDSGRP